LRYNIFYYHSLSLSFKSAQTLQVIKDYYHLSKFGYNIYLYGEYSSKSDLLEIETFIKDSSIKLQSFKKGNMNKILNKLRFLFKIYLKKEYSIIITRHYRKLQEIKKLKQILPKVKIFHEMHEEAFPFLFKNKIKKEYIKSLFEIVDSFIFTNYSQLSIYKKEFRVLPKNYIVLPNGVETEKFAKTIKAKNYVLTYLGQFNIWKNVELLFASLSLLDKKYTLRIAGGKGDKESQKFINDLLRKYNIDSKRVTYLGFVKHKDVIDKVLNRSNALLLPLGDNIQSKYLTSPMKLFEYMATSIPVVTIDYPSINGIVKNKEVYLTANNPMDFSEKIRYACETNNNEIIQEMNKLSQLFSYKNRSKRFNNFIMEIQ